MNRLTIGQQNHTQVTTFHLGHLNPPADAAISLLVFSDRLPDRPVNPIVLNHYPIDNESSGVLYAYNVKKGNFQSAAEAFAKHFKGDYLKK